MIKKFKLKKIGLSEGEFDSLVVKKIVEEKHRYFVDHFYEELDVRGDYFSLFFIWDYEHRLKNIDFIKVIRKRLLSRGEVEDECFANWVLDEVLSDKAHIKIITDKFFETDFEYIVLCEVDIGKESYLACEIKAVEKEVYKKLKIDKKRELTKNKS